MREKGADLTLMVQADMLAYHVPGEPKQLGMPTLGTAEVSTYLHKVAGIYASDLHVGTTPVRPLACARRPR